MAVLKRFEVRGGKNYGKTMAMDKEAVKHLLKGRYQRGNFVRVLTEASEYYLLTGKVVDIEPFEDSGILEFSEDMLRKAQRPDRVLRTSRKVHFYWRELQQVICD